jgi:protein phosphatase
MRGCKYGRGASRLEQIALISDIHGNLPALERVLSDIHARGIRRVICLGDLVGKGPDSDKVVDLCRQECEVVIKGNWDMVMNSVILDELVAWHRRKLGSARLAYLDGLPGSFDFLCSGHKVRLFHASQEGIQVRVHMRDPEEKHLAMFNNTDFTGHSFEPDVVGCADIHSVYMRNFRHKTLFNTGSVGNPTDIPQAAYIILEGEYGSRENQPFLISIVRLPYDIELAIRQAWESGMPAFEPYEKELRTAVYRGLQGWPGL